MFACFHRPVARLRLLCLAGALALGTALPMRAATVPERRAFEAAQKSFDGGWWDAAEREFGAFIVDFPESERLSQAILRQAQARQKLGNATGAADLLNAHRARAGTLAADYDFWLAEALFSGSNYLAAAECYARLLREQPSWPQRLPAALSEALCHARLGDWPRVEALLADANGAFQTARRADAGSPFAADGTLLLAEARLQLQRPSEAAAALRDLPATKLKPEAEWRRQFVECRAHFAANDMEAALAGARRLPELAQAAKRPDLEVQGAALEGEILEKLGRWAEAAAAHRRNLAESTPAPWRRQALVKLIEITTAQNQPTEALLQLQAFAQQYPAEASSDALRLALAELIVREHLTLAASNAAPATNRLPQASADLETLLKAAPDGPLAGRAYFNLGWCYDLTGRKADSGAAFAAAADRLPPSEDRAMARLKQADAQFAANDFRGALSNYLRGAAEFPPESAARTNLAERLLYQTLRAATEAGDLAAATNALGVLLRDHPHSFLCDRSLLLVGQGYSRQANPRGARAVFELVQQRFPDAPLAAEAGLAIARTYEAEQNWAGALAVYAAWMKQFPTHAARPDAEYLQAWTSARAGLENDALALMTNLVTQFPTNPAAPLAQNWIADYYFSLGDFKTAEEHYQLLFQKWPASELAYHARMMAGRAAVGRQGFADAIGYFTNLLNDPRCPTNLVAEGLFALGDATVRLDVTDTNNPLANLEEAVRAFSKLPQLFPANRLAVLAQGRIGDCYLQLASRDPQRYDAAAQAYRKVMDDPLAPVAARSQAQVGLALALDGAARSKPAPERDAGRREALQHLLAVVYEKNLRDGEPADPFWLRKAGLEAVRLAEELQLWPQAADLCEYLARLLPPLRPQLEARIQKIEALLRGPTGAENP